jgi:hypothetical protein
VSVVAYLVLPFAFLSGPFTADNHSVKTLREREARPGRSVEFDRNHYIHRAKRPDILRTFAGEELVVDASRQHASSSVSAKAKFLDKHTIVMLDVHTHVPWVRDVASYVGLLLVATLWLEWLGKTLLAQRASASAGKLQSNRPQG